MRILWCVTGASHLLEETTRIMLETAQKNKVTAAFSRAGLEVSKVFGEYDRMTAAAEKTLFEGEEGASSPICMSLDSYGLVVVAPCTANTAAKLAHGIADSLVTNIAAQSMKRGKDILILPTDSEGEASSKTLSGKEIRIRCRGVDLENVERLASEGVVVVKTPGQLREMLGRHKRP
ncbi:MAG: flavoprotein [Candidatus Altiarchaeota archaeon]